MRAELVAAEGWQVEAGFASALPARASRNFYAIYRGEDFGHPERGMIAAMARGHARAAAAQAGARDAAQLVVHSMAEGYFGARRTLSSRRAAALALTAINHWLFGQSRQPGGRALAPVSLTALMLHGGQIGIVQAGACALFRYRNQALTPLVQPHARQAAEGVEPVRAVGLDAEIFADHAQERVEPGDMLAALAGVEALPAEALHAALRPCFAAGGAQDVAAAMLAALHDGQDAAVMVLKILAAPAREAARTELADLPLKPAPREGDVWDGFRIGKTLYRGRYTMLKAAYDTIEQREVALKIPLPAMLQDEIFAAGFMREAWIGTTVRGANVARYIELPPERRSSLYLVMPLYRGETLEARLNRPPLVSLPEGVGIALKLCEAVQDLAAMQIIHRDIKPENIMLLEQGNEIRLLDLGLAYLPGIDIAEATRPGGTIRYMAPELLRGVAANARSEVYALGVTLYRMFAGGAYPFGQREAVPLERLRRDLPAWLGDVLGRALKVEPEARFADAGALANALQLGLAGAVDAPAAWRRLWPLNTLQTWQAAAVFFAGLAAFLALRGIK